MKNKWLVFLIIVVIMLVGGSLIVWKLKNNSSFIENNDKVVFFIETNDSKYLLFDELGNKLLTDNVDNYVLNEDSILIEIKDKFSILDKKGNFLVEENAYDYIEAEGALYYAEKNDGKKKTCYLLNNLGVDIKQIDCFVNFNNNNDNFSNGILVSLNNKHILYNKNGDSIYEFDYNDSDIYIKAFDNIVRIKYGNNYILLNSDTKEVYANFNDCGDYNEINYSVIVDNETIYYSYINNLGVKKYYVYKDKVIDLSEKCDEVLLEGNDVTCKKDQVKYGFDNLLNLYTITGKNMINENTYTTNSKAQTSFYVNNKLRNTINCLYVLDTKKDAKNYLGRVYYDETLNCSPSLDTESISKGLVYSYYNIEGDLLFDKYFMDAGNFDDNGFAIVSSDKINYYLIDINGNKVTDSFDEIIYDSGYYQIKKNNKWEILDKDLKKKCGFGDSINIFKGNDTYFGIFSINNKQVICNLENNKEIGKFNEVELNANYLKDKDKDKTKYYTYTGKLFYEN